jgi:hypothetical protein
MHVRRPPQKEDRRPSKPQTGSIVTGTSEKGPMSAEVSAARIAARSGQFVDDDGMAILLGKTEEGREVHPGNFGGAVMIVVIPLLVITWEGGELKNPGTNHKRCDGRDSECNCNGSYRCDFVWIHGYIYLLFIVSQQLIINTSQKK